MTVPVQIPVTSSVANGVTTVFPYQFKLARDTDLVVTVDSVAKTLNTDYTVDGVGNDAGGNVTFAAVPADGAKVVLRRVMAFKRDTNYTNLGDLLAATLNADQDDPIMMIQQLANATLQLVESGSGDFVWDAKGFRLVNLGDAIAYTDAVNLQTLLRNISGVVANGLIADPKIWRPVPDGTTKAFYIPGADVSATDWYDVLVNGVMIEPDDGYTIQIAPDANNSMITFVTAPADGAEVWIVLRGYAKPASDYITTLLNDQTFIDFLTALITNTLYETNTVLDLGPLKFLIPLADVNDGDTIDGSKESYLLRCASADAASLTIRANTGTPSLDWETTANAAPYFSVMQVGDGQIALAPDAGVTIKVPVGFVAKTRGKNAIITATADYAAGGQWTLSGDLARDAGSTAVGAIAVTPITSAGGVLPIDLATSSLFTLSMSENITSWTIANPPPAGNGAQFRVRITQNASAAKTMTWPSSFKWAGGTKPALTTTLSGVDMLTLVTFDGGTSYEARLDKAFS